MLITAASQARYLLTTMLHVFTCFEGITEARKQCQYRCQMFIVSEQCTEVRADLSVRCVTV